MKYLFNNLFSLRNRNIRRRILNIPQLLKRFCFILRWKPKNFVRKPNGRNLREPLDLVVHGADDAAVVESRQEEIDEIGVGSEETSAQIARIYEQIQSFTNMVCELLESGKSMLKDLSNEFEERMISIHKEHIHKWEEEIQAIRLVDASNVQENSLLHNAKAMLQKVCGES